MAKARTRSVRDARAAARKFQKRGCPVYSDFISTALIHEPPTCDADATSDSHNQRCPHPPPSACHAACHAYIHFAQHTIRWGGVPAWAHAELRGPEATNREATGDQTQDPICNFIYPGTPLLACLVARSRSTGIAPRISAFALLPSSYRANTRVSPRPCRLDVRV